MIEDLKDLTYFDIFTDKMKNEFNIYCKRIPLNFMKMAVYCPNGINDMASFALINKKNKEQIHEISFRSHPSNRAFYGYDLQKDTLKSIIMEIMSDLFYQPHNIGECTPEEFSIKLGQHLAEYTKIFHQYIDEKKWKELENNE
jgi:hypothetical protein